MAVSTISSLSPVFASGTFYGPSFTISPATVTSGGTVTALLSSGSAATFTAPPAGSTVCNPTVPSTCFFPLQACNGSLNYYQINQATVTDPSGNAYLLGSAVTSGLADRYIASPRYTTAGFAPAINVSSTDSGSIPFGTGVGGFFALTSNLPNPPNNVNPEGPYYWWTVAGNVHGANLRLDQNPSIQPTLAFGTYLYDLEGLVFCGSYMLFFDARMQFTVSRISSTTSTVFDAATNAAWTNTEVAPASAYDTATVTGSGPTPTGTVTYTFFTNGACNGTGTSAGTVTLTSTGAVPNSNTEGPLAAGSYSFRASYSGDSNYGPSTGACEPFNVASLGQVTRTLGYWQTHWRYTQFVLQTDLGGVISWSSGSSCSVTLSDTGDVLAGMLASIPFTTTGTHRTTLDQDRMILAQQLIAAILNNAAFGSSPGAGVIAAAEAAYCGTNTTTIINFANQLNTFNSGGDTLNIPASADSCPPSGGFNGSCLSTISDPQGAKSLAQPDYVDWNTPTSVNS